MKGSKGLAAEAFIIAITVVSSVLVVTSVRPIIEEGQRAQSFTSAKQVLQAIDTVVNQLSFEAPGSKRSVDIKLPEGRFVFSGTEDRIKIVIDPPTEISSSTRIEEEGLVVQGGGTLNVEDNGTDYILENPAVLFAIRKIGSESSYAAINTTNIISLIRNKRTGTDVVPKTGIFINETAASSYGNGFTQLSPSVNVQTGAIRVFVNSSVATYDAVFFLSAGADFLELEVRNVNLK